MSHDCPHCGKEITPDDDRQLSVRRVSIFADNLKKSMTDAVAAGRYCKFEIQYLYTDPMERLIEPQCYGQELKITVHGPLE